MNKKKEMISARTNMSLIEDNTSFESIESYKAIRTNVVFAMPGDGCKIIMMTSSFPKEGKTTTCVNLGIVFAQGDNKVLVIDCDLRKPRVHKLFRVKNDCGMTDVLVGVKNLEDVIKTDSSTNVDYITSGTMTKTPAELLASPKMTEILDKCKEKYDYVLLDTPPVNIVTDSLVFAPSVSGIFIVVRQNFTKREALKEAISKFEFINCPPTGIILNGTKMNKSNWRHKYYSKYGYSVDTYGYGASKISK